MNENKNEITITIGISDQLVDTFAKLLLVASAPPSPAMMGLPPGLMAQLAGGAEKPDSKPIGFAAGEKKKS